MPLNAQFGAQVIGYLGDDRLYQHLGSADIQFIDHCLKYPYLFRRRSDDQGIGGFIGLDIEVWFPITGSDFFSLFFLGDTGQHRHQVLGLGLGITKIDDVGIAGGFLGGIQVGDDGAQAQPLTPFPTHQDAVGPAICDQSDPTSCPSFSVPFGLQTIQDLHHIGSHRMFQTNHLDLFIAGLIDATHHPDQPFQPEFWIREKKKRRYLLMENCETVRLGI